MEALALRHSSRANLGRGLTAHPFDSIHGSVIPPAGSSKLVPLRFLASSFLNQSKLQAS